MNPDDLVGLDAEAEVLVGKAKEDAARMSASRRALIAVLEARHSKFAAEVSKLGEMLQFLKQAESADEQWRGVHDRATVPAVPAVVAAAKPEAVAKRVAETQRTTVADAAAEFMRSHGGKARLSEIRDALLANGKLTTNAATAYAQLTTSLSRQPDRFEKVTPGVWRLKV